MDNDNLILQSLSGRRLSAAELIAETKIPSSTLYKRLARLKDDGLIEVHADPHDGRLKLYTLREAPRPAVRRRSEAAPVSPQAVAPVSPQAVAPVSPQAVSTEPQPPEPQPSELQPPAPDAAELRSGEPESAARAQTKDTREPQPERARPQSPPFRAAQPSPATQPSPAVETVSPPPQPGAPAADGPRSLGDAELDELAELLGRIDRLGLYRVPEYDALRRLLAREQAARGLQHSRAYL